MPGQVRADYDQLKSVAGKFSSEAGQINQILGNLKSQAEGLQGNWVGKGFQQFQQEMEQNIYPAFGKLANALSSASDVTNKCAQTFQQAEQDAKAKVTITITIS